VHQSALELAAGRPARFPRPGLHVYLRGLLLQPRVLRAENPARPPGRRARRHPVLGRRCACRAGRPAAVVRADRVLSRAGLGMGWAWYERMAVVRPESFARWSPQATRQQAEFI